MSVVRSLGLLGLSMIAASGCTQSHSTEEGSNGESEVVEESLGTTSTPGKAVFTMPFAKAAALATASDSVGNIVVVGTFWGKTLDVGGIVLTGSADAGTSDDEPPGDGWVAKIDPYGKTLWAKVIGGLRTQEVDAVAVDKDDNIAIGGAYMGSPTICGTTFTNSEDNSAFIAKLGPDGSCRWALPNAAPGYTILQRVAFDPSGNVFAIGSYAADRVSFGGATAFNANPPSYSATQQFLFKISPSGVGIFGKSYGDPKTATNPFFGVNFADLAVDGAGNVIFTGSFNGTVSFGGPAMTAQGSDDVMPGRTTKSHVTFLAKLANDGSFRWAKQFGTHSFGSAVAASADGHIAIGGSFLETLDLGDAYTETSGKSLDGYVAKLDGDGKAMWVKHLWGSPYNMRVDGVAFDSYVQVVAAGHFDTGTLHIGGSSFTAGTNTSKTFVTKLSKIYGSTLWAKAYGTTGSGVAPNHFSLSGGNRILLPGSLNGSVDFGSGTVSSVGGGFLTRLAP